MKNGCVIGRKDKDFVCYDWLAVTLFTVCAYLLACASTGRGTL